jgi:hypothetical protein
MRADDQPDMSASDSDLALIDDAARALRAERHRAPGDLLALLTTLVVAGSVVLLGIGVAVGPGVWQDLLLNLSAEGIGVAITVAVIGGLWQRVQANSYERMDDLIQSVEARKAAGLTDEERDAFGLVVELHRSTWNAGPLTRQIRGYAFAIRNRRRLAVLEDLLGDRGTAAP